MTDTQIFNESHSQESNTVLTYSKKKKKSKKSLYENHQVHKQAHLSV